jgi:hypothetical protein
MAGGLPSKYMGAIFLGHGISGIASNVFRALSLVIWPAAANPSNQYIGVMAYVLLASVFTFCCGMCQFVLKKNEFAIYHLWKNPGFRPRYVPMHDASFISDDASEVGGMSPRLSKKGPVLHRSDSLSSVSDTVRTNFRKTKGLLYALCSVVIISVMIFPGTVADTSFTFVNNLGLVNTEAWYQLTVVFIYNCFDTVGRWLGGNPKFDLSRHKIRFWSHARVIFIATFLLTDFVAPPAWIWNTDWFKLLNLIAFAMSNGYLATMAAVKAPGTVKESRRALVGAYIGICVGIGVLIGACLGVGMTPILKLTPKQQVLA